MKEVQEQRKREVYAQQAKDALIKSFWIIVLVAIGGGIMAFILKRCQVRGSIL